MNWKSGPIAQYSNTVPPLSFPVNLDSTKTFFVDQQGKPVFAQGETPFDMPMQLTAAQVDQYLNDRAAKGFNIMWIAPVDNVYSSNPPNNQAGNAPFSGGDFLGMSSQSAYWNFVDTVMQRCLYYGITVLFNPCFIGDQAAHGYLSTFVAASTATIQAYANFLVNRYIGFPNLIWLLGGDANTTTSAYTNLSTLATQIKSLDKVHLMTIESLNSSLSPERVTSVDGLTTAYGSVPSWLDINWVYVLATNVTSKSQSAYSQGYPCLLGEDQYELESSMTELNERTQAYASILAGCTLGRLMGNGAIWPFSSPNSLDGLNGTVPWQGQLNSATSVANSLLGKLFRSREWQKLVPDISNVVMTVGSGNGSICARTSDGQSIIAYLPSNQTITIDMSKITDSGSQANCNWFDPTNGVVINIGTFANSSTRNFTTSTNNASGDPDWLLVIDSHAANLRPPGA